jgi:uncharacterized membrane protein
MANFEDEFHGSWYIIAYKFLFGLAEFILGLSIALFGKAALRWYRLVAARELIEDPHDLLVRLTSSVIPNALTHRTFLVTYLLVLGAAKIAGAIGLLYKKNWGVDLLVALTFIMFPFQFVQLIQHPTMVDFLYIMIGLFIALYLVNFRPHEWVGRVAKRRFKSN